MSENTCLEKQPLSQEMLEKMNAYWRAANYLSAGQLYLLDNPLLKEPLTMEQIKKKIVGHWGTVPGQNFIYTHLNRIINKYDLNMIYLSGPGHGGNGSASANAANPSRHLPRAFSKSFMIPQSSNLGRVCAASRYSTPSCTQ